MSTQFIGKTLKGYELVDHIGSGGYGAVYRAQQQVVGREVAVKVILPQFANSSEFVRRFEAEAQFIARLEHPHIVPLFDYWRDPDGAYLVMRYVSGGSLAEQLKTRVFTLDEIARFLEEITGALSVAHRNGVVHLDLKPDNILMDADGNSYLTDFGIAKAIDGDHDKTADGSISGTIAYTSPEQLQSRPPTPKSDIYSLGIIVYQMLAGQHPFEGKTITSMIMAHLMEDVPELDDLRPDLPKRFYAIVAKATHKDPDQRYDDVRELAISFRNALESQNSRMTAEMLAAFDEITNPYKGLRPFEEADAHNFFGRERVVEQLLQTMQNSNFLAVVGPSGSGKSSVVKAGLIPQLRQGAIAGSSEWFIVEMVPGTDVLQTLAAELNGLATRPTPYMLDTLVEHTEALHAITQDIMTDKSGDILLFIDQFEEIFTQTEDEAQRLDFLEMLRYAVVQPNSRLRLVITLRADFYDRPLQYEGFGTLMQRNTQVVLPLSTEELEAAIVSPAKQVGVQVDADLVATIIADVREEPGALPLLQYALTELFERRDGLRLTLDEYTSSGGVNGALAKRAEEVYNSLIVAERRTARQVFLRLVTLGEGEEDTRRRARYSSLITLGDRDVVQEVLDVFGRYRLLTFDTDPDTREPLTEVAHEALIRSWKRLREWLYESRGDVRLQRALNQATTDWLNSDKDVSFLLRGSRLEQFDEWADETDLQLSSSEREFLDASIAERERLIQQEQERLAREHELEERARQRLRQIVIVLTIASIIGIGLTFFAFNRSIAESVARATSEFNAQVANTQAAAAATAEQDAVAQRETSEFNANAAATAEQVAVIERELAEQEAIRAQSLALSSAAQLSLQDSEVDVAVALALAANSFENPPPQSKLVLAQVAYSPGTQRLFNIGTATDAVDVNRDGTRMVTASRNGTLTLWNLTTGEMIQQFEGHTNRIVSVKLSENGSRLLSGSWDDTAILWDVRTGEPVIVFEGHEDNVLDVDINLRAAIVATASSDGTARIWNLRTGEVIRTFSGHDGAIQAVAISADAQALLTGGADNTVRLWDLDFGSELGTFLGHEGRINAVDFDPNGGRYLSASDDGTVRLFGANFFIQASVLTGHEDRVLDAEFSGDGRTIFSVSRDGTLNVWDAAEVEIIQSFEEHTNDVLSVAASYSGRVAITGSADDTVRMWVIDASAPEQIVNTPLGERPQLAFNPAGNRWAYGALGRGIRLYAAAGAFNQQIRAIGNPFSNVVSLAFNDDGSQVASGLSSRVAEVWSTSDGQLVQRFTNGHTGTVSSVAFTTDGTGLITGSFDANVIWWDIETGEQIHSFEGGHDDRVFAVATSPIAPLAVSGSNDGSIVVWDLEQRRERLRMLGVTEPVYDLVFSMNGNFLFSAMGDGTVRQWDINTGREVNRFVGHRGPVRSVALRGDGETMLSGSDDGTMVLWDLTTGTIVNRFNTEQPIVSVAFHPSQTLTISGNADGTIAIWRTFSLNTIADWVRDNRYVVDLTCAQRQQYNLDLTDCS